MELRVIGVIIGIAFIFGWFAPLSYYNMGGAFGDFFSAFGSAGNSNMNTAANNMSALSQQIFGNTYAVVTGQKIGGIAYLIPLAGAAYAYFSWVKNRVLLVVTAVTMLSLIALIYLNYVVEIAWGFYLLLSTAILALPVSIIPALRIRRITDYGSDWYKATNDNIKHSRVKNGQHKTAPAPAPAPAYTNNTIREDLIQPLSTSILRKINGIILSMELSTDGIPYDSATVSSAKKKLKDLIARETYGNRDALDAAGIHQQQSELAAAATELDAAIKEASINVGKPELLPEQITPHVHEYNRRIGAERT